MQENCAPEGETERGRSNQVQKRKVSVNTLKVTDERLNPALEYFMAVYCSWNPESGEKLLDEAARVIHNEMERTAERTEHRRGTMIYKMHSNGNQNTLQVRARCVSESPPQKVQFHHRGVQTFLINSDNTSHRESLNQEFESLE